MDNKFKEITLLAPAKINIYLGVTGKRDDGYHDIDSVMQTVGIFDKVKVAVCENAVGKKIEVVCPGHEELGGEKNIAYRMTEAFMRYANIENYNVYIEIEKNIPMEAGIGGGSSDAAEVAIALNSLCGTGFSTDELMTVGKTVGADVPFLIKKGTAFVQGIGERITPCKPLPEATVLVAYPNDEKVSTGKAYAAIDEGGVFSAGEAFEAMKKAVEAEDLDMIAAASHNIFETVIPSYSSIFEIKKTMMEYGAVFSLMSGSGSAVFGIFREEESAKKAAEALSGISKTFVCGFCK